MTATLLNVETLKELREQSRLFIKLDFLYLAALGAVFTALKFGVNDFIDVATNFHYLGWMLVALVVLDGYSHGIVFNDWFSASSGVGIRQMPKLIHLVFKVQNWLHTIFVAGVIYFAVSWAFAYGLGKCEAIAEIEKTVLLQEQVELYIKSNGSPPKSLDELRNSSARIDLILDGIRGGPVKIDALGSKNYKITYAGNDGFFGTSDDRTDTHDILLRESFTKIDSGACRRSRG